MLLKKEEYEDVLSGKLERGASDGSDIKFE